MNTNDEIDRIQSEIALSQQRLREDVSQIKEKVDQTRAEMSPTAMIQKRLRLFLGGAAALGFWVGCGNATIPMTAPAARTMPSAGGKRAAAELSRRS